MDKEEWYYTKCRRSWPESSEGPMATEQQYSCGENTYYVVHRSGRLFVEKASWVPSRESVAEVDDIVEALDIIRADAGSSKIEAR
jgi:hypothetical protein